MTNCKWKTLEEWGGQTSFEKVEICATAGCAGCQLIKKEFTDSLEPVTANLITTKIIKPNYTAIIRDLKQAKNIGVGFGCNLCPAHALRVSKDANRLGMICVEASRATRLYCSFCDNPARGLFQFHE